MIALRWLLLNSGMPFTLRFKRSYCAVKRFSKRSLVSRHVRSFC